jgi:hypothetical protein
MLSWSTRRTSDSFSSSAANMRDLVNLLVSLYERRRPSSCLVPCFVSRLSCRQPVGSERPSSVVFLSSCPASRQSVSPSSSMGAVSFFWRSFFPLLGGNLSDWRLAGVTDVGEVPVGITYLALLYRSGAMDILARFSARLTRIVLQAHSAAPANTRRHYPKTPQTVRTHPHSSIRR